MFQFFLARIPRMLVAKGSFGFQCMYNIVQERCKFFKQMLDSSGFKFPHILIILWLQYYDVPELHYLRWFNNICSEGSSQIIKFATLTKSWTFPVPTSRVLSHVYFFHFLQSIWKNNLQFDDNNFEWNSLSLSLFRMCFTSHDGEKFRDDFSVISHFRYSEIQIYTRTIKIYRSFFSSTRKFWRAKTQSSLQDHVTFNDNRKNEMGKRRYSSLGKTFLMTGFRNPPGHN